MFQGNWKKYTVQHLKTLILSNDNVCIICLGIFMNGTHCIDCHFKVIMIYIHCAAKLDFLISAMLKGMPGEVFVAAQSLVWSYGSFSPLLQEGLGIVLRGSSCSSLTFLQELIFYFLLLFNKAYLFFTHCV